MIRRRGVLKSTVQVFGAALPLMSSAQSPQARFKGITLRISYPDHPHFQRVERQFSKFTELTGIALDGAKTPYLDMKARQLESAAKPAGDFDLLTYLILWKLEYAQKGCLRPLNSFLDDPRLARGDFALSDLITPYLDAIGRVADSKSAHPSAGKIYGLPCGSETSVLAARMDLLKKHHLSMPTQYTELLHACRVLKDREQIGGLATRGLAGHHITHAWLLHLTPHGGQVFDRDWNATVHRPGAVRATEVLRDLMALAPAGVEKAGFAEMQNDFLQGRAAFYLDSSNILGLAKDETKTRFSKSIAYAMHPSGTRLSGQTGGFGMGIAGNSAHPEASFLFLQWLASRETDLAIARDGGAAARWSTLSDPDFQALNPEQSIMRFALRAANPDWRPLIPEWDHMSQKLVGQTLPGLVYGGKPIEAGLSALAADLDAELQRSGRKQAPATPAAPAGVKPKPAS